MQTSEEVRRRWGQCGGQRGGGAAMVALAHKREGVRSRLQCLWSGTAEVAQWDIWWQTLSGHDRLSPVCHLLTELVTDWQNQPEQLASIISYAPRSRQQPRKLTWSMDRIQTNHFKQIRPSWFESWLFFFYIRANMRDIQPAAWAHSS